MKTNRGPIGAPIGHGSSRKSLILLRYLPIAIISLSVFSPLSANFTGFVRFETDSIKSFSGDKTGTATTINNGAGIKLTGNRWVYIKLPRSSRITENTVIEFDFLCTRQGEIHGIGFENNTTYTRNRLIRLYGTQKSYNGSSLISRTPNRYDDFFDGNYSDNPGVSKHYKIRVHDLIPSRTYEYFDRLVFVTDNDANKAGVNSTFSNVHIYEDLDLTINFNENTLWKNNSGGEAPGTKTPVNEGTGLLLTGNQWVHVKLPHTSRITANSYIEFDYQSTQKGEIHAIALDHDTKISYKNMIRLFGTQMDMEPGEPLPLRTFGQYAHDTTQVQHYSIPLQAFFPIGTRYNRIVFIMDNDHDIIDEGDPLDPEDNRILIPNGTFSNVRLVDKNEDHESLRFDISLIEPFSNQDGSGIVETVDAGNSIRLTENRWVKYPLPLSTITKYTTLEFDFYASAEAEMHGILLESNNTFTLGRYIHLSGTQKTFDRKALADRAVGEYVPGVVQHYKINLSEFFTIGLNYDRIVFVLDDDSSPRDGDATFSNVRIYEGYEDFNTAWQDDIITIVRDQENYRYTNTNRKAEVALVIKKNGKIVHHNIMKRGTDHYELDEDYDPDRPHEMGSLTKQFVSMALAKLIGERLIDMENNVSVYLPGFENLRYTYSSGVQAREIKVKDLIHHNSGLLSFRLDDAGEASWAKWRADVSKARTFQNHLNWILSTRPTRAPGITRTYNNSGYVLLAQIIEVVAKANNKAYQTYQEAEKALVFDPMGFSSVVVQKEILGSSHIEISMNEYLSWEQALSDKDQRLAPNSPYYMDSQYHYQDDGDRIYYGFGWYIDSYNGLAVKRYRHSGTGSYALNYVFRDMTKDLKLFLFGNKYAFTREARNPMAYSIFEYILRLSTEELTGEK